MPTDWARVLRALVNADLDINTLTAENITLVQAGARAAASPPADDAPPAVGKIARRSLTEKLTDQGLRFAHLTVLATLDDLGPQTKGALATYLDMNTSDASGPGGLACACGGPRRSPGPS